MGVRESMRDLKNSSNSILTLEKQKELERKAKEKQKEKEQQEKEYIKGISIAINKDLYNYFMSLFEKETQAEKINDILANCNLLENKNKKIEELAKIYQDSAFTSEMAEDTARKAYNIQLKQAYKDKKEDFEAKRYFENKEKLKIIEELREKAEQEQAKAEQEQAKEEKKEQIKNVFKMIAWSVAGVIAFIIGGIAGMLSAMGEDKGRKKRR